jgi:predicted phage terminase large subunit-like protein
MGMELNEVEVILKSITADMLKDKVSLGKFRQLVEIKKEMQRERCKKDLIYLCTEVLDYKDLDHDVYREMAAMLRARDNYLADRVVGKPRFEDYGYKYTGFKDVLFNLFLIPRSCMKTSLLTIGSVIQDIIVNPDIRILISNVVFTKATEFLNEIKDHFVANQKFIDLFGKLEGDPWGKESINVSTRKRKLKEYTIECGSPGHSKTGKHYDRIIGDDLIDRTTIVTYEAKENSYKYFQDLFDLREHPLGAVDIVGTHWDLIDLYYTIKLPVEKGGKHITDFNVFTRRAYEGSIFDPRLETSRLNFPWKLDQPEIERLRRQKDVKELTCQYQNEPVSSEDAPFKESFFRYYDRVPADCFYFVCSDPAASKEKRSDFSVVMCLAVDSKDDWYVVDIVRDRLGPGELDKAIFDMCVKYNAKKAGVEGVAFQKYVKYLLDRRMAQCGRRFVVEALKPGNIDKEVRIRRLEPRFRNGGLYFPKTLLYKSVGPQSTVSDMVTAMKDELLKTTWSSEIASGGDKRDMADTLAYFTEFAYRPGASEVVRPPIDEKLDPLSRAMAEKRRAESDLAMKYADQPEEMQSVMEVIEDSMDLVLQNMEGYL